MPLFLNPRGKATYGEGICARCDLKFSLQELFDDPNYPGLKVCRKDMDQYDPYRLPPREPDPISLPFTRPDVPLYASQSPPVAPGEPGWLPFDSSDYPGM